MAYGNFALGGFNMGQMMAGQQGRHLAGMANQLNSVIGGEMDSRVAQIRELRRMMHEQALLNQRMQLEREKAMVDRDIAYRSLQEKAKDRRMQMRLQLLRSGARPKRTLINGRWVEDWGDE